MQFVVIALVDFADGTLRRIVKILLETAKALGYAHSQDVLHLDLKPANIKIGRFGEVCVIDWGLSKAHRAESQPDRGVHVALDRKAALVEHARGTKGYSAPEQWRGDFHTGCDVYSVGAILHHALSGARPPVAADSLSCELPAAAREKDPALAAICAKAMAQRPEERHASMAALQAELQAYLTPPRHPPGLLARLGAALRRNSARPQTEETSAPARLRALRAALDKGQSAASDAAPRLVDEALLQAGSGKRAESELVAQALAGLERRLELVAAHGMDPRRVGLRSPLARGAQAEVLAADDLALRRPVAVKRIQIARGSTRAPDSGWSGGGLRHLALFDEAQIAAQLDHPSVLCPHDLAVDAQGRLLLVLPLASGGTLASRYAEAGPAKWSTTVPLLLQASRGLGYAHEKGVVHRDVKALNILLGRHDDAYIGDWALAVLTGEDSYGESSIRVERGGGFDDGAAVRSSQAEDAGARVGTLLYMAPEQAAGGAVGPASDVYSLGLVLLELLTGWRRPGAAQEDVLREALEGAPPAVRKLAPQVPEALEAVCRRALQTLPEDRFENAGEFALALEEALDRAVE